MLPGLKWKALSKIVIVASLLTAAALTPFVFNQNTLKPATPNLSLESLLHNKQIQISNRLSQTINTLSEWPKITGAQITTNASNNEDSFNHFQVITELFRSQYDNNFVNLYQISPDNSVKSSMQPTQSASVEHLQAIKNAGSATRLGAHLLLIGQPYQSVRYGLELKAHFLESELGKGIYLSDLQNKIIFPILNEQNKDITTRLSQTVPAFTPQVKNQLNLPNWQLAFNPSEVFISAGTASLSADGLLSNNRTTNNTLYLAAISVLAMACLILIISQIKSLLNYNKVTRLAIDLSRADVSRWQAAFKAQKTQSRNRVSVFHRALYLISKRLVRKRNRLNIQQQQIDRAQNIAQIGTFELHCGSLKLECSQALLDILELDHQPKITDLFERLETSYANIATDALNNLLSPESSQATELFDCRYLTKNNQQKYLYIRLEKFQNAPDIILGCINDITDLKNTQQNLAKSLQRLAYAQEATNDGMWDWDIKTNKIYLSPRWLEMMGYQRDEISSDMRALSELVHPDDQDKLTATMNLVQEQDKNELIEEFRLKHKNSAYIWILSRAKVVSRDSNGAPQRIIGSNTDVTKRKLAENKLRQLNEHLEQRVEERTKQLEQTNHALTEAKEKAEQASQIKGDFLANMSHEIRTPISAIIGLTNILGKSELSTDQQRQLKNIDTASHNLLNIINDILDFSKIEAGKLKLEKIHFNLTDIISNISVMFAHKAQHKGLEYIVDVEPNVPFSLIGDPHRLNQILINLISNAIKFTESGQIELKISLKTASDLTAQIQFEVKDTGIGLSQSQIDNLFQSFNQADNSTSRKYGGTGLGLTICRQLCQLMKGDIRVSSEKHHGSVFTFELPFSLNNIPQPVFYAEKLIDNASPVLIVENNPRLQTLLTDNLITFSYTSQCFKTIDQASDFAATQTNEPIPLIIINSLCIDNFDQVEKLVNHDNCKQAQIVIQQAHEQMRHEQDSGNIKYIERPLHIWDLFKLLKHPSEQARLEDANQIQPEPIASKDIFRGLHILVVEDNEINQEVARAMLEHHGFDVTIAEHGKAAIELLSDNQFDLILMDVQMPEMDGYQATAAIRDNPAYKNLPIIAMTANVMPHDIEKCIETGMNDHLSKPIDEQAMLTTLATWLGKEINVNKLIETEYTEVAAEPEQHNAEINQDLLNASYVNANYALSQVSGNQSLITRLQQKFIKDFRASDHLMQNLFVQGELEQIQKLAHSIKGVSGNLGLEKLHLTCKLLETNIALNDREATDYWINQFSWILGETLKQIEQIIEGSVPEDTAEPEINIEQLISSLLQIKNSLENDEFIDPDKLTELKQLTKLDAQKEYKQLLENIDHYDHDSAIDLINELIIICQKSQLEAFTQDS